MKNQFHPFNTRCTAVFVYSVGQSVSPQSERIPLKCLLCFSSWLTARLLRFVALLTPLKEFVSKKSHFLCVPKSQDCCLHGNSGVVDGGGGQFPERGKVPVRLQILPALGAGLGCAVLCKLGAFHNCTESRRKCLLCLKTTVTEHRNVL